MNKKELIKQLKICGKEMDKETAHIDADDLLLQFINDDDITKIWNKISESFWYA